MTLTLDDDVAALLARMRKRRGLPLKILVNEALREGLLHLETGSREAGNFHTRSVDLGACRVGDVDDISEILALADGKRRR